MNRIITSESAPDNDCDVFVIGGGPAGSTIATLLAKRGLDVVLAEKDTHPRFHIGESLLPMNLELFEQLGVLDQVREIGLRKPGVEFNSPVHDRPVTLKFSEAWDKTYTYAYQVRRAEFDKILFDHCVRSGARAMQECRVSQVKFPVEGGVSVMTCEADGDKQWQARYLVDASGRDTFLGNRFAIKRRNPQHATAALYGHFEAARRLPGDAEGNISLFWFEHGWFWFIPLRDGTTSVGAVCTPEYLRTRRSDPSVFLLQTIALCPELNARLQHARLLANATATGNYSYVSSQMSGERYLMVGDAYAFVDPVFSSGVYLAMRSAFLGADVVEASLREPAAAAQAKRRFENSVRHGLRNFSWFIYRMTRPAMRTLFMKPRNHLRIKEALMSLLAGDLYRNTPIYASLFAFKVLYYITSVMQAGASFRAWRAHRRTLRAT
ncbi:MAG: tryptophan 7-halogenase [Betaproteobacteria bacterium]|nr:MAG: tryptophan 7-halogenase [Betaproteobacteria bacterium]